MLESTDKGDNTTHSEHIRLTGIPTACIKYDAEQNNMTALDVYNTMFENNHEV